MNARLRIGSALAALIGAVFAYREISFVAAVPFVLGGLLMLRKGDAELVFARGAPSASSVAEDDPDHQQTAFLDIYGGGPALRGRFRAGTFVGRSLASLSVEDLVLALGEIEAARDQDSAALLRCFLDQSYPDWATQGAAGTDKAADALDLTAALQQLGLSADATVEEIKQRFADLSKVFHTDHGGNDAAMRRLIEARNLALAAAKRRT